MERQKTLRFADMIGMAFSAFVSLEVIASQAAMGPSLIFCFLIIGGVYLVLHSLLCSELGSTYPDQGGIYVWVKNAFGDKWAARTTWWYWVNVAAFIPSAFVVMGSVFQQLFMPEMSTWGMVILCIVFTWITVLFNCMPLKFTKWLPNVASICKIVVCVALVGGAVWFLAAGNAQTEFTAASMIPTIDIGFFALIPVYVYALTGMDLISCSAGEMENPRRDVPRCVFSTGVLALVMYIITACAILVVLPQAQVNESSGVVDALFQVYGGNQVVMYILGAVVIVAFVGYALSWALGGNKAAQEAASFGELPAVFAKTNKNGSPVGSAVLLGLASTALLLVYGFTATSNEALFWSLLAFTSIIFFLPYIMMSGAFITLRKKDPDAKRPFRIPGGNAVGFGVAIVHAVLIIGSVIFYFIAPEGESQGTYALTLGVGLILTLALGEFLVSRSMKKQGGSGGA